MYPKVLLTIFTLLFFTQSSVSAATFVWKNSLETLMRNQGWLVLANHPKYKHCSIQLPSKEQADNLADTICSQYASDYETAFDCKLVVLSTVDSYSKILCDRIGMEVKSLADGTKVAYSIESGWYEENFLKLAITKGIIKRHTGSYCMLREPTENELFAFGEICRAEFANPSLQNLCNEERERFVKFTGLEKCKDEIVTKPNVMVETTTETVVEPSFFTKIVDFTKNFMQTVFGFVGKLF
jgi:hypothetical protein